MAKANPPSPHDLRRTSLPGLRAALSSAEQVATNLTVDARLGVPAEALLSRLAAIRAEVDLIEATMEPHSPRLKGLEANPHPLRSPS